MEVARLTSKAQVTVPKAIRKALGIERGVPHLQERTAYRRALGRRLGRRGTA